MGQTLSPSVSLWRAYWSRIEGFGYPKDGEASGLRVIRESPGHQYFRPLDSVSIHDLDFADCRWPAEQCLRNEPVADPEFYDRVQGIAPDDG